MSGDPILEAIRAGWRPSGAALAVALAWREWHRTEDTEPTVAALGRLLGYSRSALHRARAELDDAVEGWRDTVTGSTPPPARTDTGRTLGRPAVQVPAVQVPAAPEPPPLWREAVAAHAANLAGARSWDLYADVYAPAADVCFASGDIGELIALTVNYLESETGAKLERDDRKRVAQMVRRHGKTALFAFREAMPRVDVQTVGEYCRYASAVARSTTYKIRHTTNTNGANHAEGH